MNASVAESLDHLASQYAAFSVAAASQPKQVLRWYGTAVSIAGIDVLIGAGELDQIIETPQITPIPGTKHWVMGIAAHKGGLLPILSGDDLFCDSPYTGGRRDYCLVIKRPGVYLAITLSEIQRDLWFKAVDRDMSKKVESSLSRFCLGGFYHQGAFLPVLDIDSLISDADLLDASASSITSAGDKQ